MPSFSRTPSELPLGEDGLASLAIGSPAPVVMIDGSGPAVIETVSVTNVPSGLITSMSMLANPFCASAAKSFSALSVTR